MLQTTREALDVLTTLNTMLTHAHLTINASAASICRLHEADNIVIANKMENGEKPQMIGVRLPLVTHQWG